MHPLSWGRAVSTNEVEPAAVAIEWSAPGHVRVVDVGDPPLSAADIALIVEDKASRWTCRLQGPGGTGGHLQPRLAAGAEQHSAGGSP